VSPSGQQRRPALITVADKCLLYSESDRIAAWTRNVRFVPGADIGPRYFTSSISLGRHSLVKKGSGGL
jgi:hypothetical protein